MSISKAQIILLQQAVRKVGLIGSDGDRGRYLLLLKNRGGGVESSKELNNTTFEDVMATLEGMGWQMPGKPKDHFRNKVDLRGTFASSPAVQKIEAMAAASSYKLPGLVRRFSHQRTDQPSKLTPAEAGALIEMLKGAAARAEKKTAQEIQQPRLFPEPDTPRATHPPAPRMDSKTSPQQGSTAHARTQSQTRSAHDDAVEPDDVPF